MTDEHFIRQWTESHERFTADVDKGLAKLRRIIDAAYGDHEAPVRIAAPSRSETMLAGIAASALTALLFVSTVAVVTPGTILA